MIKRAMILAAGYGKRLQPFTKKVPKPLLEIQGEGLIQRQIKALAVAGIEDIMINLGHLGPQIPKKLGDGKAFGVRLYYHQEPEKAPFETGGGVRAVLDWFADQPFILSSADIWSDYDWAKLAAHKLDGKYAHLVLYPKPKWLDKGDFSISEGGVLEKPSDRCFTYANFGVFHPRLWDGTAEGHFPLKDLLFPALDQKQLSGEIYEGPWFNIGCRQRLAELCGHLGIGLDKTNIDQV